MEITGRVKLINKEQQISSNYKKRELVVMTEEQFPQTYLIEFSQDKCDLLNNFKYGDLVKVSIDLRGREWVNPQGETKYFNSIQGWRIEKLISEPQHQSNSGSAVDAYYQKQQESKNSNDEEKDDLPF